MNTKILLDENEIPKKWYNIQADLKTPLDPPMHPQTKKAGRTCGSRTNLSKRTYQTGDVPGPVH